jgi:hypothetical protein
MYIYQAAVLCDDCGEKTREALRLARKSPRNQAEESTYESDDYPKGPYDEDQARSDTPDHCDYCGVFLENSLTEDGYDYVVDQAIKNPQSETIDEWLSFYDLGYDAEPYFDRFDICEAYYLFASHYHGGQWSAEYRIFGRLERMGFKPGANGLNYHGLSENARGIYIKLARKATGV